MKMISGSKRISAVILCLALLCGMLCGVGFLPTAAADEEQGMTFTRDRLYQVGTVYDEYPNTMEAWVCFPTYMEGTVNVILSNYYGNSQPAINFGVNEYGQPYVHNERSNSGEYEGWISKAFTDVNLYTGEWTHLAITRDGETGTLTCYVNGEQKQQIQNDFYKTEVIYTSPLCIGGDIRSGNRRYFQGQMRSVTVYADARTADEIKADMTAVGTDGLIANYDLTTVNGSDLIIDQSGNGYHASCASGKTFTQSEYYQIDSIFAEYPNTMEVWVRFAEDTNVTNAILSNYYGNSQPCIYYGVNSSGHPFVQYERVNSEGVYQGWYSYEFTDVNVFTGEWVHLTIARGGAGGYMKCFVNGEFKQGVYNAFGETEVTYTSSLSIGGDIRANNARYFQGEMRSLVVYADERSDAEVASDYATTSLENVAQDNLLAAYDLIAAKDSGIIADQSGNGYHAVSTAATGMSFAQDKLYQVDSLFEEYPNTIEAWVYLPEDMDLTGGQERPGVVFSNYAGGQSNISMGIGYYGVPNLWVERTGAGTQNNAFDQVHLWTGEWIHLAITRDASTGTVACYVDGEKKQEITSDKNKTDVAYTNPLCIGGDIRTNNTLYFKGQIRGVATYADVRTDKEITADMVSVDPEAEDLIASWDMTAADNTYFTIADQTINHYDANLQMDGMTFTQTEVYQLEKTFNGYPNTIEAWVYLPEELSTETAGVIFSNYYGSSQPCISLGVRTGGHPNLWYERVNADGTYAGYHDNVFDQVNLCTGEWTHLAITRDASTGILTCYVNGEKKQEIQNDKNKIDVTYSSPLSIGGDIRNGNGRYFQGAIRSLLVYNDVRTEAEIAADVNVTSAANVDIDNILAAYDMTNFATYEEITDLTGQGYDAVRKATWFDHKTEVTDYAYSMVAVGDTQIVVDRYPDKLHYIYDWILENKESKNIQYVMGMGDVTDWDTDTEYRLATEQIARMDGVVPYSLIRGNHDTKAQFNEHFDKAPFNTSYEGSYYGALNSYNTLTVGDVHYLILALDFGADDSALAWAADVIESHPYHTVIITTHGYIEEDGEFIASSDGLSPSQMGEGTNSAEEMWNKLFTKYDNVSMILCGHISSDDIIVSTKTGTNGNIVTQMLVDGQGVDADQGAAGLVGVLYFSEDGKKVTVEQYSTIRNQYYMTSSQFEMEVAVTEWPGEATVDENGLVTVIPGTDYEVKAGTLVVTDANGNKFVPTRVGFQTEDMQSAQYQVDSAAVTPYTVDVEFYKPTLDDPNVGIVGTQVHAESEALRFIHRLNIKNGTDGYTLNIDGEAKKVADFGLLLAAQSVLEDPDGLDIAAAEGSKYIKQYSYLTADSYQQATGTDIYYDISGAYVDISVQVNGIVRGNAANVNLISRVYVTLEDGTVLYGDLAVQNYTDAGAPAPSTGDMNEDFGNL